MDGIKFFPHRGKNLQKAMRLLLPLLLLVFQAAPLDARGFVVKGGYTSTRLSLPEIEGFSAAGGHSWHAGIGYQGISNYGFSLQPEILYKAKGVTIDGTACLQGSQIEVPLNIQWGIDLLIAKPYVFVAPFVSYSVSNIYKEGSTGPGSLDAFLKNLGVFDYGFGAGFGLDIAFLQLNIKYNWYFGQAYDWSGYLSRLENINRNSATLDISLGFKF